MEEDRNSIFVKLLAEHERRLQHYVRTLIPNANSADDVLQESKIAMWQHFDKFEIGTNFNAWAHRFVFNRVLAFRKTKKRDNDHFILSDDFYEMISEQFESNTDEVEEKIDFLKTCLENLPQDQKSIMKMRYYDESSVEDISEKIGKKMDATYRSISRIRVSLRECVSQKWAVE